VYVSNLQELCCSDSFAGHLKVFMATKCTCLVLQCRAARSLFAFTLGLLGACAEDGKEKAAVEVILDASVLIADGGGTLGGGGSGSVPGGGLTGGGTPGAPGEPAGGGMPGGGGASDAGAADAGATVSSAGFPRVGEAVNVSAAGPYQVVQYDGPPSSLFDSSTIYYPTNATPPFAIIALSPGFTYAKEDFVWWGQVMASHGFAIAVLSPTFTTDFPRERADDLEAGIQLLKEENVRSSGPLFRKLDVNRAGLLGHSMGGGAALLVMARSNRYQAAVAWEPWGPAALGTEAIRGPTMILAGELDLVASPNDMGLPFYLDIPLTVRKVYAEFVGVNHYGVNAANPGVNSPNTAPARELHARWTLSWMKLNLENDTRYRSFVQNGSELSRFGCAPVDECDAGP
jgi:pimeloyl-ACP methyl ester carboxylesterase